MHCTSGVEKVEDELESVTSQDNDLCKADEMRLGRNHRNERLMMFREEYVVG